jgi:hypothetical protein
VLLGEGRNGVFAGAGLWGFLLFLWLGFGVDLLLDLAVFGRRLFGLLGLGLHLLLGHRRASKRGDQAPNG